MNTDQSYLTLRRQVGYKKSSEEHGSFFFFGREAIQYNVIMIFKKETKTVK